jgi:hypothetical protein
MIKLGETLASLIAHEALTEAQRKALHEHLMAMDIPEADFFNNTLDALLGGSYYLVEDTPADFEKVSKMMDSDADTFLSYTPFGLDFAEYLLDGKLAVLGVCTSNAGGDSFVFTEALLTKYPEINYQIEHAYDWAE